jgi:hypothetical protein
MSKFYLILPLIVISSTIIFPLGMNLSQKIGSKLVILIGGIVVIASVLMASFAVNTV